MTYSELLLVPPSTLSPHEEIIPDRVAEVTDLLIRDQSWTSPICIERTSRCIMDGHHRHAAALRLGLALVPVVTFDYENVRLGSWRPDMSFEPDEIVERARRGILFPHKSTRHVFPPVRVVPVPLHQLVMPGVERAI
ncbi:MULTISPECIES: ParB N-terminal domain-containing protein [Rhizobium/Agrobacterium group]|uniref:ParB N-terminal domain-containing protein n=1 Tax=Rhizobium/Agrobacterium group TaxID=227290 RepID=UPI001ADBF968|nr:MULTISPECIES: ParB N-terminal domain-containing protein [Rhizobium/Agrobacterium group]MBO9112740.1 ParB N-terminal domain-containing protein [Agrobacterium sp. S2/73]QXZ76225.1 ParB N-terminal domain-containing protein [Agrobacterium sp. S7/73]QYA17227.1 ParB N-terminal domain-containing protein [Rhizobium sp. AB2/73]UEQ85199.1 ParB N-terminal domain-containing protein [Rhizobium sp. AB2/73]